jgi:hypothetical protein
MPKYNKYNPGDENKRLAEVNTYCPVKIFIIDLQHNDDIVFETELDFANHADRKRLGRLTAWAVMNGHSVETMHRESAMGEKE